MEGLEAQINNLNKITFTNPGSVVDLLTEIWKASIGDTSFNKNLYVGNNDCFWNIFCWRQINLYAVKCINKSKNRYTYEVIVFDDFPKDKTNFCIDIDNIKEDISLDIISDTCIRFDLSNYYPENSSFKLLWHQKSML